MNKKIFLVTTLVMTIAIIAIALIGILSVSNPVITTSTSGIGYKSDVYVYKNNELIDCSHNMLYDTGKDLIKTQLGNAASATGEADQINLCNATGGAAKTGCGIPTSTGSETYNEFANCGMGKQTGTYSSMETGNWSIWYTFTSTCDNILVNATRLNQTTGGLGFAGNNFTLVTLMSGDSLTINWTMSTSR